VQDVHPRLELLDRALVRVRWRATRGTGFLADRSLSTALQAADAKLGHGSSVWPYSGATPVSRGHLTARRSAAREAGWVDRRNSGFRKEDW
jgi:hypothetical protein